MSAMSIDELNIKIESESTNANKALDELTASLGRLSEATKGASSLNSVISGISRLGVAARSLKGVDFETFAPNIVKLADSLKPLNSVTGKLGATITSLARVKSIAADMGTLNFDGFKTNINTLVTSLEPLGTIQSKLGSSLNQLGRLPSISASLNNVTMSDTFGKNIDNIATSLSKLGTIGNISLSKIIGQLATLPSVAQGLNSVDFNTFSTQMEKLGAAFGNLSGVSGGKLASVLTQLGKLPEIAKSLSTMDMDAFTAQMERLAAAMAPLAAQCNAISSGFARLPQRTRQVITAFEQVNNRTNKVNGSFGGLLTRLAKTLAKLYILFFALKRVASVIAACFNESNDYIETLNLFRVTMGKSSDAAYEYAEKVQNAMGIDIAEWMQNQGVFQNLITGFGVASKQADIMSKNLTQLSYDFSSFFNDSVEDSAGKLQSAMAGQVKGLRAYGIETTVAAMQEYALSKGITQSVRSMTMAQKTLLRYNLIMEKSVKMQGDMGRTLITPANSMRILNAQMTQLKRALGNIVSVFATRIIPYVQIVVMLARDAANYFANIMGFELPEIDYSGLNTAFEDADDESGNVSENLTKIQKQLMGFDEFNVLGQSSGSGGIGGIGGTGNWTLPTYDYDFLKDYDNQVKEMYDNVHKKLHKLFPTKDGEENGIDWGKALLSGIGIAIAAAAAFILIKKAIKKLGEKVIDWIGKGLGGAWEKLKKKIFPGAGDKNKDTETLKQEIKDVKDKLKDIDDFKFKTKVMPPIDYSMFRNSCNNIGILIDKINSMQLQQFVMPPIEYSAFMQSIDNMLYKLDTLINKISHLNDVMNKKITFNDWWTNLRSYFTNFGGSGDGFRGGGGGRYADGGFPTPGELFWANENGAGPELVGRIGRKTAVANSDQIVQAVSNGVYNAVTAALGGQTGSGKDITIPVEVKLDGQVVGKSYVRWHNGVVKQTGSSPLLG